MKRVLVVLIMSILSLSAVAQTRCKGVKANGEQCKITAVNTAGYCRFHDPTAPTCTAIKKDGKRCKMKVKEGVKFCQFHNKQQ
jgi:hypothetical protein